ncbi:MAG: hypothetical protein PHV34_15205 [Verrucomicrobiae bacterium]|nr:hypothetical protein [Verrucomicrobiae bacterium]
MSALAVVLRMGVDRQASSLGLNAAFRGTAGVVTLIFAAFHIDWGRFPELWRVAGWAGMLASVFFWFAGFASIKAVQLGPLSVSWTVLRCSMVLPAMASLLYWQEVPLAPVSRTLVLRLLGMGIIFASMVVLGLDRLGRERRNKSSIQVGRGSVKVWLWWLVAVFWGEGAWEISLRATRSFPDNETRLFFVTLVFIGAFVITLPVMGLAGAKMGRFEWGYGSLAGVCGMAASGSRVWALRDVDGMVVFPVTTVSVMLLVQLAGCLGWREKTSRMGWAGFLCAIAGVLFLTLKI